MSKFKNLMLNATGMLALCQLLAVPVIAQDQLDRTVLPIQEPKAPLYTELDARNAKPPPRFADGLLRLDREPGQKGYWDKPTAVSLVEDGVSVPMDAAGKLVNLEDAAKVAPFQLTRWPVGRRVRNRSTSPSSSPNARRNERACGAGSRSARRRTGRTRRCRAANASVTSSPMAQ